MVGACRSSLLSAYLALDALRSTALRQFEVVDAKMGADLSGR